MPEKRELYGVARNYIPGSSSMESFFLALNITLNGPYRGVLQFYERNVVRTCLGVSGTGSFRGKMGGGGTMFSYGKA